MGLFLVGRRLLQIRAKGYMERFGVRRTMFESLRIRVMTS
jgi:hypothetical protein